MEHNVKHMEMERDVSGYRRRRSRRGAYTQKTSITQKQKNTLNEGQKL